MKLEGGGYYLRAVNDGARTVHMWQGGHCNPCEMQDRWECTFLKDYPQVNTKWALNRIFIIALYFYCNFENFTL